MHRINLSAPGISRREMLCRCANGFGGLALATLLAEKLDARGHEPVGPAAAALLAESEVGDLSLHGWRSFPDGYVRSQAQAGKGSWADRFHWRRQPLFSTSATRSFRRHFNSRSTAQCGADVSELFPHVATCVDDLVIIRSMVADHSEHTAANYFMHSGSGFQGRPSMGAWLTYGLGSECENLPGFVVLESGLIPPGGLDLFGSGFLPASYQGTLFRKGKSPIADLEPRREEQRFANRQAGSAAAFEPGALERFGSSSELEATIANYELAFRMQAEVPGLMDLQGESEATRKLYGLDETDTQEFGLQCLLARRLVQRGVRFVELLPPARQGIDRWDQHGALENGHRINAKAT